MGETKIDRRLSACLGKRHALHMKCRKTAEVLADKAALGNLFYRMHSEDRRGIELRSRMRLESSTMGL